MASSSTMIETACPTCDTGSTICLLTRLTVTSRPESGGRICTPAKRMPAGLFHGTGSAPPVRRGPRRVSEGRIAMPAFCSAAPAKRRQDRPGGASSWTCPSTPGLRDRGWPGRGDRLCPDAGWLVATRGSRPGSTYRLGDPFPDLSMTVPEGWTMSSTELGSTRFGQKGQLKRVACEDLPRDFPEDEAPTRIAPSSCSARSTLWRRSATTRSSRTSGPASTIS